MNCFDTFITSICDGNVSLCRQNCSKEFVNRIYEHEIVVHKVIKIECEPKKGHKNLRPIHLACDRGQADIVKLLINIDCDIEAATKVGNMPIHIASSRNHWQVVIILLNCGSKIDAVDSLGRTGLHVAAMYGCVEAAKGFLLNGICTEKKDSMGNTAQMVAEMYDNAGVISIIEDWMRLRSMLKNTHRRRLQNLLNQSSFKKFYLNNNVRMEAVIEYLTKADKLKSLDNLINELRFYEYIKKHQHEDWLKFVDIEAINKIFQEESALTYCFTNKDNCPYFCNHLIQLILDMDSMEETLEKIYKIVSRQNIRSITAIVMKRQYFVHTKRLALWNRLHLAVSDDRCDMIEYLLVERLVNINSKDEIGNTPLFHACIYGYVDSANLLLRYGADVNTTNKYGQSLLQVTVENGMYDLMRPLLNTFKSIANRDCLGHAALDVAIKFVPENVYKQFLAHSNDIDQEITNTEVLTYISRQAVNNECLPVSRRKNQATLCFRIKGYIYESIISRMSLEALQERDENGNSWLHLAAWSLSFETCRNLVQRNIDVNLQNDNGNTAMHEAVSVYIFDYSKDYEAVVMIVRILNEAGADITIKNRDNKTSLQLALLLANIRLIKELTNSRDVVFLERDDLERMLAEKQYDLMIELMVKMEKERASHIITEDFIEMCSEVLDETGLRVVVDMASAACREGILARLVSSETITSNMALLLHCLLRCETSFSNKLRCETALTYFLRTGNTQICEQILLTEHASLFIVGSNDRGESPLHIASEKGYLQLIELILSKTNDFDTRDNMGNTPLGLLLSTSSTNACKDRIPAVARLAEAFIRAGADINIKNDANIKVIDQCIDQNLKNDLITFHMSCKQQLEQQ